MGEELECLSLVMSHELNTDSHHHTPQCTQNSLGRANWGQMFSQAQNIAVLRRSVNSTTEALH